MNVQPTIFVERILTAPIPTAGMPVLAYLVTMTSALDVLVWLYKYTIHYTLYTI